MVRWVAVYFQKLYTREMEEGNFGGQVMVSSPARTQFPRGDGEPCLEEEQKSAK